MIFLYVLMELDLLIYPIFKLIEFYIEKEKKDKSLKEYFEGEEINYSILDSFYVIKQEYDFSHEESYEFPSNILYLKDNEIVAFFKKSYYSNLLFIKINNNKFFEKKDIKSTSLGIIDNRIIFLFFIKEKNYLLCGCEKGLFIIDNTNKIIIKKLLPDYYVTCINLLLNGNIILGITNKEEINNLIEFNLEKDKIIKIQEDISDYTLEEIIEIKKGSLLINYETENVEIWKTMSSIFL